MWATPPRHQRYNVAMKHTRHIVIGSGPTGTHTARLLAQAGEEVTLVSRRGTDPGLPGVRACALDATDVAALTEVATGSTSLFNCAMPRYDRWPREFPPLATSILTAAERSGAALVTLSNTYGYGPVEGPMHEALPMAPHTVKGRVRAQMWQQALASRARVTEVRASDYLGRDAVSLFQLMTVPDIVKGQPTRFPGDLDAVHSWSFTHDVAKTLIAASRFDGSWGRAWHVPSNDLSVRALSERIARLVGAPAPRVTPFPKAEFTELAANDPILQEVVEMLYLYDKASVLDTAVTRDALRVSASPLDVVLQDTLHDRA